MSATAPPVGTGSVAKARASNTPPTPSIWGIAGRLSRTQYWAFAALGLVVPFVVWAALSAFPQFVA